MGQMGTKRDTSGTFYDQFSDLKLTENLYGIKKFYLLVTICPDFKPNRAYRERYNMEYRFFFFNFFFVSSSSYLTPESIDNREVQLE